MDEQEFDSLFRQPFGVEDAMRADARWRRCVPLGVALWGRTSGDLQRQLLAPHPEIPAGFDLDDFRELQRSAQIVSYGLSSRRFAGASPAWAPPTVSVGSQRFTVWEARGEVVRRAIEYLENH
jgi:hypothetical protein